MVTAQGPAYRAAIAAMQDAGRDRDALAEAIRWLRAEVADVQRRRPRDGAALCRELTARMITLAEAVPAYRAAAEHGRSHRP